MNLAAELLDQAVMLAGREPKNPKQASLRRAVSAEIVARQKEKIGDII